MIAALARFATNKTSLAQGVLDEMDNLPDAEREDMRFLLTGLRLSQGNFSRAAKQGIVEFESMHNRQFLNKEFQHLLCLPMGQSTGTQMSVFALTNPAIPASILKCFMKAPGTTRFAQIVMAANPNCPKAAETGIQPLEMPIFAAALCAHGDLERPFTKKIIFEHIFGRWNSCGVSAKTSLCRRRDLPEDYARELSEKVSKGDDYTSLARTAGYGALTTKNALKGDFSKMPLSLSPDLSARQVCDLFEAIASGIFKDGAYAGVAALASHPNATENVVKRSLALAPVRPHLREMVLGTQSRHAEHIIRELSKAIPVPFAARTDVVDIRDATPAGLLEAFRFAEETKQGETAACIVAHPKFPMRDVTEKELLAVCDNKARVEMYMAMSLSVPGLKLLDRDPENYAIPALFSPQTSGVQLEKLAREHPGLAALAACHPNGGEIDVAKLAGKDQAEDVLLFRDKFRDVSLAGKAGAEGGIKVSHMLEI